MSPQDFTSWLDDPGRRCLVMGVLNVTPDSFSDGGRFADPSAAVEHALSMCGEGADIIDVGGESTRPGSSRVPADEQIRRVLPVVRALAQRAPAVISVDTTRPAVAEAALNAGASIVNDVSAGTDDPAILAVAAQRGCALILMHMQGQPATMQAAPAYADVVEDVSAYLRQRIAAAAAEGIDPARLLVDPGIGFGKTVDHNLQLLRHLARLKEIGRPVVIGTSRKSFIGRITGESEPSQRLWGTAATVAWSVAHSADIVRVHDVGPMARVVKMVRALAG